MSSKSYADAVSGSSGGEESVTKLSNTFWRKYQVEDEEEAFTKAIESSKVSTKSHVNLDQFNLVDIQYNSSTALPFL